MKYTVNYADGIGIPTDRELEEEFVDVSVFVLDKMSELPESSYLFLCIGYELALLRLHIKEIRKQMRVDTATWGLVFYEEEYGIKIDLSDTLENRRARVKVKMKGQKTSTVKQLEKAALEYGQKAEIIEHNLEYYFTADLVNTRGFPKSLKNMYESINELKPSHLGIEYKLTLGQEENNKICMGALTQSGQTVTIYPYKAEELESRVKVNVPVVFAEQYQEVTIYPKKEE